MSRVLVCAALRLDDRNPELIRQPNLGQVTQALEAVNRHVLEDERPDSAPGLPVSIQRLAPPVQDVWLQSPCLRKLSGYAQVL